MIRKLYPLYLINVGVLLISGIIIIVQYLENKDIVRLKETADLCIAFWGASVLMTAPYYFDKLFYWKFTEENLQLCIGKWKYRKINSKEIKSITLQEARSGNGYPLRNKDGRQKVLVSLYSSEITFLENFRPQGFSHFFAREKNLLARNYMDFIDMEKLFEETEAKVYVTEQMLKLYQTELGSIFERYSVRVLIMTKRKENVIQKQLITYRDYRDAE